MPAKQQATTNNAGVVVSVGYRSGQCLLGASSVQVGPGNALSH